MSDIVVGISAITLIKTFIFIADDQNYELHLISLLEIKDANM